MSTLFVGALIAAPTPAGANPITASADPSIATVCAGTTSGTTFMLTADCDTTAQLTIPDGTTVDGSGHIITAHDPLGGFFTGAVLTNEGTSMHVQNLTVKGTGFAFNSCAGGILTGIYFNEASGSVSNVNVQDITQHSGCNFGLGIRANALTGTARTVNISNTTVTGYQKGGLVASGTMTMNVSNSTIGPADPVAGRPAQNGIQFGVGSATGSVTNSTVYGSFFPNLTGPAASSAAFLFFDASNVTLANNIITGVGSDFGMSILQGSTGITVANNHINRDPPVAGATDPFGTGIDVDSTSDANLICNTFSGWNANLSGTTQLPCIITTILPDGTVGTSHSANLDAAIAVGPGTWTIVDGSLPPGITLHPDGTISGTPTTSGTYTFTVSVTDALGATSTREFTVTIAAPAPETTTTTTTLPTQVLGESIEQPSTNTEATGDQLATTGFSDSYAVLGTLLLGFGALLLAGSRVLRIWSTHAKSL